MADRRVTRTGKSDKGEITKLCNDAERWSRSKTDAIADIEEGKHSYHVLWPPNDLRTEVRVVNGPTGKYLRTDRDKTTRNNLLDLEDC